MIDHWLDQPMTEPSLMLIVALQVAPKQVEGTAETVVSLLLASPQVAADLMPLALLHRPEQVKGISHEAFHYAFARAFDWGRVTRGGRACRLVGGYQDELSSAHRNGIDRALSSPDQYRS
ncbi:hypothetical protein LN650_12440 [Klebsiella pneumoniae subsp. pneumoniae]|nr:hypothetical protein [Klebsiella pneumoniae subsp. pneumoniae]